MDNKVLSSQNYTQSLVDAAYAFNFNNMSSVNRQQVQFLLCDGLAALFQGLKHPTVEKLLHYFEVQNISGQNQWPGLGLSLPVTDAAFVYGIAAHVLDFEPMFDPPTHAVSPVLGTLLALALEDTNSPIDLSPHFLNAFTVGIELQADLREAARISDDTARQELKYFPFQKQGFHPPGTVGVMGSALAASLWLGLDKNQACMALGMAASRAGGIAANIGTSTKAMHSGNAARAGLECALLVKHGFTASSATFDERGGWGEVFGGEGFKLDVLADGMRSMRCFSQPGFAFKKWPAHTAMQVAISAALKLHDSFNVFDGEIEIEVPHFPYCDRPKPQTTDECRFSFQFNVVKALLDGHMDVNSYSHAHLNRTDISHLLGKTKLKFNHRIPADFTKMEVRITLSDGRKAHSNSWPGHWNDTITAEQVADKFVACTEHIFITADSKLLCDALLAPSIRFDDAIKMIKTIQLKERISK
ncbi:MAG: MmgE/PrpD family protein [Bacteroidia bacterium]|jgi:aconitate decarboxylase